MWKKLAIALGLALPAAAYAAAELPAQLHNENNTQIVPGVSGGILAHTLNGLLNNIIDSFIPISSLNTPNGVNVDNFGAAGNGFTDDKTAFQAAFASLGGKSGVVTMTCTKQYYVSNLQIPAGITLLGCYGNPDNPGGVNQNEAYGSAAALLLSGTVTSTKTTTTTLNSTTVTVSDNFGIVPGMSYDEVNLPGGSYVVSITDPTHIVVSTAATATSGATISSCLVNTNSGLNFATLVGCSATSGIAIGAVITSANVPGGTTVVGILPSGQFKMSANATATANNTAISFANPASESTKFTNTITLGPIAGLKDIMVYRAGMTFPAADDSAYTSTAVRCGYLADACFIRNALIMGFAQGFTSHGEATLTFANSRIWLEHVNLDTISGVYISGSGDSSLVRDLHVWPFARVGNGGTTASISSTGPGLELEGQNDATYVDNIFTNNHGTTFILGSSDVQVGLISSDSGRAIPSTLGVRVLPNATFNQIDKIMCFGPARCLSLEMNATETIGINNIYAVATGNEAVTIAGGNVGIGVLNTYGVGADVSSPVIAITSTNSDIYVGGGTAQNTVYGYVVATANTLRADLTHINITSDLGFGASLVAPGHDFEPPIDSTTVASPLGLYPNANEEFLTHNFTLSTINGGSDARQVRLHFTTGMTVSSVGNIVVPGSVMVFPANSWADFQWNYSYPKWIMIGRGSESSNAFSGSIVDQVHNTASLQTCNAAHVGATATVSDWAAALAWGATYTVAGTSTYLVWCNGTNWTVAGK